MLYEKFEEDVYHEEPNEEFNKEFNGNIFDEDDSEGDDSEDEVVQIKNWTKY